MPITFSFDADRASHRRPSFPIPPWGWCAPRPPTRRRGAQRHCQRHQPRGRPAAPGRVENQPRPRPGATRGNPRAYAGACSAPAKRRSPGPVAPAALARAPAHPPSLPVRVRQPPRMSQPGRRALHPGGIPPTEPQSLCGPQHAAQGLRSRDRGSGDFRIRPVHPRSHVARTGHDGSRGNASQPVAAAEHRARWHQGRYFVSRNTGRSAHHRDGCRAPGAGPIAASAGAFSANGADQLVGKRRAGRVAGTAVWPTCFRPPGRRHDHRPRTPGHARHRCPVRTCRARKPAIVQHRPIVPPLHTVFCALAPPPPPLPPPAFPSRRARRATMPAAAKETLLRRLYRSALRDRAPNPAHVKGNERGHRTGVPPS